MFGSSQAESEITGATEAGVDYKNVAFAEDDPIHVVPEPSLPEECEERPSALEVASTKGEERETISQMNLQPSSSSMTSSSHPSAFAATHSHLPRPQIHAERRCLIDSLGGEFAYKFNKYMARESSPEKRQQRVDVIRQVEEAARETIRERMRMVLPAGAAAGARSGDA